MTTLLAIETSCDETGVAIVRRERERIAVLADALASQVDIHRVTGGVVPDVAAREHAAVIGPLIADTLSRSGVAQADLSAIAVTVGPGLMPALAVGVQAARTLSYVLEKPIVPVHHLEGHITSALLSAEEGPNPKDQGPKKPQATIAKTTTFTIPDNDAIFPALALIVSGGHTMLVRVDGFLHYEVLGSTRDDAAGEAFDKVARLLQLPYPGGPEISRLAETGDPAAFSFARPMQQSGDLDFSFSGLKTDVLYTVRDLQDRGEEYAPADIAASFQQAVVDSLVGKTKQALRQDTYKTVLLTGGVAANSALRRALAVLAADTDVSFQTAPQSLCGDNAVMIGQAAVLAFDSGRTQTWQRIDAAARIPLTNFSDGAQTVANIEQDGST